MFKLKILKHKYVFTYRRQMPTPEKPEAANIWSFVLGRLLKQPYKIIKLLAYSLFMCKFDS